ncbi:hypothetical protein [Methanobrevibacter sp. UBA337]|jgi:hypothetical protein|uniref:hypothetical protein n=1 Tax=Methanobrevibacter sp. UBA337 TaxID=1915480 RepID=UPI0039B9B306
MESSLITKALNYNKDLIINSEVVSNLKSLESKEENYFLDSSKNKEYNNISRILIKLNNTSKDEIIKIKELSGLIYLGVSYFKKSVDKNNIKYFLIFTLVMDLLKININELINSKKISKNECLSLLIVVTEFIQNIDIKFVYNPYEIYGNFNSNYENKDLTEIYDMLFTIELKQRYTNSFIEKLLSFLIEFDFNQYLKVITNAQTPQKIILFLNNIKTKNLIATINESDYENKWLNFELLRQLIKRYDEKDLNKEKIEKLIEKVLTNIYLNDFNFFKQTINRFNNCEIFNYSLGMFLSKCSWCDLERITADCLIIDQYKTGMLQKDKLLTAFNKNNINKRKYNFFILLIFHKWDDYLDCLKNKDSLLINLALTDYCNYIIRYYSIFYEDEKIISSIIYYLSKIIYIDSKWFSNETMMINYNNVYLTKVYLLFIVYKYRKLINKEVDKLFEDFEKNKFLYLRFWGKHLEEDIKLLKTTIDGFN